MTIDEIKELIHVVNESGIAELEVQRGDARVRIQRGYPPVHETVYSTGASAAAAPQAPVQGTVAGSTGIGPMGVAPTPENAAETDLVKSPIVGTFYECPSPGAPPFVKVGDHVSSGQVLCIIESMKLMNEIEADAAGVIESKLVQNGQPVEYGESLFGIRPV
jgi:acetyl-CoA carboxylase biotin carboxyl carrier protein